MTDSALDIYERLRRRCWSVFVKLFNVPANRKLLLDAMTGAERAEVEAFFKALDVERGSTPRPTGKRRKRN